MKIEFENISKAFGSNHILSGVSGKFESGKSTVILGGSGGGKSVLIKILCGLLEKDTGKILIDGLDIDNISKAEKSQILDDIGFLFQGAALFDSFSVWENIAFKLLNKMKISRSKARDIAAEKIEMVGLKTRVLDLDVNELSGGMKKRVSLARTIASDPKIIFFDEPTTGLDPVMSEVIGSLVKKCQVEIGSTNITVTHDMSLAKSLGEKVVFLYKGSIIWSGIGGNIFHSGNEYLDQFVHGRANGPIVF